MGRDGSSARPVQPVRLPLLLPLGLDRRRVVALGSITGLRRLAARSYAWPSRGSSASCGGKCKTPPSTRDEGALRGTTLVAPRSGGLLIALTGEPAAGWTQGLTGRACPARIAGRQASSASTSAPLAPQPLDCALPGLHPSPARWRLAYYSCPGQYSIEGGPSGIRTHDLLNAIETRSQLRYGPWRDRSSGPGGIRTLDLFSAIEARSQLRYRPARKSKDST